MKRFSFISFLLLTFALLSPTTNAANEMRLDYLFNNKNKETIFNSNNIYPGWNESKIIKVTNNSEKDSANIYLKFKKNSVEKLAEKINIYVIRISDNSYRLGGIGDRINFNEATKKDYLYIDKLNPQESERYKIKVVFDEKASNEYQNLNFKFDLKFSLESRQGETSTEAEILSSQNRDIDGSNANSNKTPTDITATQDESKNILPPPQESSNIEKEILGEKDDCLGWPLKNWMIILLGYIIILLLNHPSKERRMAVKNGLWQIFYTLLALTVWLFLDKCHGYIWFPIAIAFTGTISYFMAITSSSK